MVDEAKNTANLFQIYNKLEDKIHVRELSTRTTYSSPVNFVESMQKARHRWFPYKEGFSPSFVSGFLKNLHQSTGSVVLDPFSGSGTTSIVAGEMLMPSIGIDVSPLTNFVSQTKSLVLSASEISRFKSAINDFENSRMENAVKPPDNETVIRYFDHNILDLLLGFKAFYGSIANKRVADLFKLAMIASIEPLSTHRKAGNGVKRKTRYLVPAAHEQQVAYFKELIIKHLQMFLSDLQRHQEFIAPQFNLGSCLDAGTLGEVSNIAGVLTSPPYANCFDYSKIYMSELWLGDFFQTKDDQAKFRANSVRSHVHATWAARHQQFGSPIVTEQIRPLLDEQKLWSPKIGGMIEGYFEDLGKLLSNLKPRLQKRAKIGFVVGNSFYGGVPIATDLLLSDVGMRLGYTVEEIRVYRSVIPSSQQYKILNDNKKYMRESLVILGND